MASSSNATKKTQCNDPHQCQVFRDHILSAAARFTIAVITGVSSGRLSVRLFPVHILTTVDTEMENRTRINVSVVQNGDKSHREIWDEVDSDQRSNHRVVLGDVVGGGGVDLDEVFIFLQFLGLLRVNIIRMT